MLQPRAYTQRNVIDDQGHIKITSINRTYFFTSFFTSTLLVP